MSSFYPTNNAIHDTDGHAHELNDEREIDQDVNMDAHNAQSMVPSTSNLFQILNSQKPNSDNNSKELLKSTTITNEDYEFLKAANEVIKMNEHKVDPTIRDILNRLQYSNSPHGGLPISMQYLQSITDSSGNDNYDSSNSNIISNTFGSSLGVSSDSSYNTMKFHQFTHNNNVKQNRSEPAQNSPPLLEFRNLEYSPTVHEDVAPKATLSASYVPPFTENPIRGQPNNFDFPQFSLDIFKNTNEDLLKLKLQQSLMTDPNNETLKNLQQLLNQNGNNSNHNILNNHFPTHKYRNIEDSGDENQDSESDEEFDEDSDMSDNDLSTNMHGKRNSISSGKNLPRNYICSTCGLTFKRSSDLKRHEKIHLKVPPNICPLCQKGFARKDALKRHEGTLTCKRNRDRLIKEIQAKGESL